MVANKQIVHRPATLIPTKKRSIRDQRSTKLGIYRNEITVELARKYPTQQLTPADVSYAQYGNAHKPNRDYVRRILWKAYTELQNNGELWYPVYSATGSPQLIAIKQFLNDEEDKKAFPFYLNRALKKKEITQDRYETLAALANVISRTDG